MYEMKEEYKIGINAIDEQHKKLFELTENTHQLLKNEFTLDKYDRIVHLIEELKEYTIFHFKTEEEYMDSIGYKRMFMQKVEHDAFIKKISDIDLKKIDENQDDYIIGILKFLNDWLVEHILEKDMLIGK
jgi:hemerythrin